jgi:hypothetical protein
MVHRPTGAHQEQHFRRTGVLAALELPDAEDDRATVPVGTRRDLDIDRRAGPREGAEAPAGLKVGCDDPLVIRAQVASALLPVATSRAPENVMVQSRRILSLLAA